MLNLFRLVCAGLFLASNLTLAATETTTASSSTKMTSFEDQNDIIDSELHYVDIDSQSRRKNWDVFSVLLMMIHSECGPHGEVHLPDCHLWQSCKAGTSSDCNKLCSKKSEPGKSKYEKFCSSGGSSSSNSASSANGADAYNENTSPGQVVADGNYAVEFQFWMVAVVLSLGMAGTAVHLGQRREIRAAADPNAPANVRGSVSRRVGVVSDLMDSVLGQRPPQQVEMAQYNLEGPPGGDKASALV